jgi:predicted RNA-binding protein associated with RNAse of E/G family
MDVYDELVYKSESVIVGRGRTTSAHSIVFNDEVVLATGFQIVYFELTGKWFSVGKIRNLQGKHTGYYCDIVTPPRLSPDGVEVTDLFLDLWVAPNLTYKVLDKEELEDAFQEGWITKQLYDKAKKELKKLISNVKEGKFPPSKVKSLEAKLQL